MGKMEVDGLDDLEVFFRSLGQKSTEIIKASMYEGAAKIANALRAEVEVLPTEPMRYLRGNDRFNVFTETNKRDMLAGIGISKFKYVPGGVETYIGFTGYGSVATKAYPRGIPNILIARSINSGKSIRVKNRFVAQARNKSSRKAVEATQNKAIELINKMEG